jgi:hypothetical protein
MTSEKIVESWLAMLRSWQALGQYMARHIVNCPTCTLAELCGGKGYCAVGDKAWSELMEQELRVVGILPELREAGIDVEKDCRAAGFQFMAERATKQ